MPILRVARAHARAMAPSAGDATDSSDFGLLGEQSSPKWEIPCPRRRWTTVQSLTPLALSPDWEIRNRTNTKNEQTKKTVTVIFTPCLSACVDNNNNNAGVSNQCIRLICSDTAAGPTCKQTCPILSKIKCFNLENTEKELKELEMGQAKS